MCSMWRLLVALSICLFESKICVVELSTMQHVYYSETNRNQAHFLFTAFWIDCSFVLFVYGNDFRLYNKDRVHCSQLRRKKLPKQNRIFPISSQIAANNIPLFRNKKKHLFNKKNSLSSVGDIKTACSNINRPILITWVEVIRFFIIIFTSEKSTICKAVETMKWICCAVIEIKLIGVLNPFWIDFIEIGCVGGMFDFWNIWCFLLT